MGRPSISANFFSPSMYGSLPKALSHEERLSISRNTPASASLREIQHRTPVSLPPHTLPRMEAVSDDSLSTHFVCSPKPYSAHPFRFANLDTSDLNTADPSTVSSVPGSLTLFVTAVQSCAS